VPPVLRAHTGTVRLLVAEDDARLADLLRRGLAEDGHVVDVVGDGEEALWAAAGGGFDALVLDVGLPGRDGLSVCRELRRRELGVPVLLLTARDAVTDRVAGLDAGADDYLPKPFSLAELLARLRALGRRGPVRLPPVLSAGHVRLDPASRRVWRGDDEVRLSARELALLEAFLRRPGQVLTRDQLLTSAWELGYEARSNVVDVYVGYLREKLGHDLVETVRGQGYRLGP
jgi:two-component system, OmpR family, response regulator